MTYPGNDNFRRMTSASHAPSSPCAALHAEQVRELQDPMLKTPRVLVPLILCAFALCQSASAAGRYVIVEYPPSDVPGELHIGVTYTLWIPDGVQHLRAVIVHQHGAGTTASKEGSTAAYDLHWRALAKKWDCALLGPSYHVQNELNDTSPGASGLWFDPLKGSEKTFLKALGALGEKSGHRE